jgi:hypothetical protein
MSRLYQVLGALALALFAYANVQGWSLFQSEAQMRAPGSGASSGRLYHK